MEFVLSDNISVHDKKQYQTFIVNVYSMYVIDFPAFKAAMLNKKSSFFRIQKLNWYIALKSNRNVLHFMLVHKTFKIKLPLQQNALYKG